MMILLKMLSDHKHSSLSTTVDGAGLAKVRQKYEGARKEVGTESPAPAKIQKFLRSDLHNSSTECEVIWTMCLKFLEFHLACLGQALRISTSIEKPRGTTKVLQFRTRALSGIFASTPLTIFLKLRFPRLRAVISTGAGS